jgi:hypothetical protein
MGLTGPPVPTSMLLKLSKLVIAGSHPHGNFARVEKIYKAACVLQAAYRPLYLNLFKIEEITEKTETQQEQATIQGLHDNAIFRQFQSREPA